MSRATHPLLLTAVLGIGIGLGFAVGRALPTARVHADDAPAAGSKPLVSEEDAAYRKLADQYGRFQPVDRTFEMVSRAVSPAVVHIVARKVERRDNGRPFVFEETGSGVLIRAGKGKATGGVYVLTNHHVVDGASARDIQISLHDGRLLRPERAMTDASTDIAILKLAGTDLPTARLGDSDEAPVGSWVLALGSPFGLTQSVTQGIISARMRHEDELEGNGNVNQEFLQTDAAINPGNSGGPLVNMKGEVIGINTAIATNGGGSEGVGFSIPINLARWAMAQLVESGKVTRGAMGVHLDSIGATKAQEVGLDRSRGAVIEAVVKGSPAEQAGLRVGDVVLDFNGTEVVNANQLINMISMTPVGRPADLVLWRGRRRLPARVVIVDRDIVMAQEPTDAAPARANAPLRRPARPAPSPDAAVGALGLELSTLDAASARVLSLPETTRGVAVTRVDPSSPLASILRPQDVLNTVGGRAVRSAEEAGRALAAPRPGGKPLEIGLERNVGGTIQSLTIQVP